MQQDRVQLVCKDGQVHFLPGPQNQILLQCNSMNGDVPRMIADGFSVHKPGKTTVISADFDTAEVRLTGKYTQQSTGFNFPDTERSGRTMTARSRKSQNSDIEAVLDDNNRVTSIDRGSSPDRLLNLKFQEVSPENPFNVAPEFRPRAKSVERIRGDPMASFKADFDKVHNISPEQRKSMVVPDVIDNNWDRPDNRRKYSQKKKMHDTLYGGNQPQDRPRTTEKKRGSLLTSPYKGLTDFQTQLIARDPQHVDFQQEAREQLRQSGGFTKEVGLHMMEPEIPQTKTHSSPKRRGQAPVQGRSQQPMYNHHPTDLDKNKFRNTSSTLVDILSPQLNKGGKYPDRRTPTKQANNQQANVWNRLSASSSPDKKAFRRSPYTWRYVNNEGEDLRAGKTTDFFENAHVNYRQFERTIGADIAEPERQHPKSTAKFGDGGSRIKWPSKKQDEPEMFDFHKEMRNAPKMAPIDQAIDQTFDSEPVPAVQEKRVKPKSPVRFGLQEPVYGRVSQSLLKDFKQKPLHVLDENLDLTTKEAEFKKRPQYHHGFLMGNNESFIDPNDLKAQNQLHRLVNGILVNDRRAGISELTWCMKMVHDSIRDRRQELLNSYIAYQAVKIQKNWRGYYARKYLIPFRQRLGVHGQNKLEGAVLGWKTRAIMRVPEISKRAQSILDHDIEIMQQQTGIDLQELKHSRKNTVQKFRHLIDTLHRGGQWTMLKWTNLILDESKYTIPKTKEEEQQLLDQIMNNQKALHQMALKRPKQGVAPYMKINMNSSPTNSTSFIEQHSNGFDYDITSNKYKKQAKEILERRKNYRPGQRSPESHQVRDRDYGNPYKLSEGPRSPPRVFNNLSGTNLRNGYIDQNDRWDLSQGRIKLKGDNVEGRKSFVRRMTYEPDLRKRANNDFNGSVFTHGTQDNDYLSTIKERRSMQRSNTKAVLTESKEGGRMMLPPALKGNKNPYLKSPTSISDLTDFNVQAAENIVSNNQNEIPRKPRGQAATPGAAKEDISYLPNKVRIEGLYKGQKTVGNEDPQVYRSMAEQMKQHAQKELERQKQQQKVREDLRKKYGSQANSITEFGEVEDKIDEKDPSVDPFYDQRKQQDQMMEEMLGGRSKSLPFIKGNKPYNGKNNYQDDEKTEKDFNGQQSIVADPFIHQQVAEFDIFDPQQVEAKKNFAAAQKEEEENYNNYIKNLESEKSETERKIQEEEAKIIEDHDKEIKRLDDIRKKAEEVAKYLQEKSKQEAVKAEQEKQRILKDQQEFKDKIEREKADLEKQRKQEQMKLEQQRQEALDNQKLLEEQQRLLTAQKNSAIPEFEEFNISDGKSSTFKIDPMKIGSPDGLSQSPLANNTRQIDSPDSTGTFGFGLEQIKDGKSYSPISQSKLPTSPYNDDGDSQFNGFKMNEVDNRPKAEKFPGMNEEDSLRVSPSKGIKLSKDQLKNLQGAYNVQFGKGSGKLNKKQLKDLLGGLEHIIPNDQHKNLLNQAETDHNDEVDFDEFCNSLNPEPKKSAESIRMLDKLKEAFLNFSKTGTILLPESQLDQLKENFEKSDPLNKGKLTPQELANHLQNLDQAIPESNFNKLIELAKPNRDGKIDFKDFIDKVIDHQSQPHGLDDQLINLPEEQIKELKSSLNKVHPYHNGQVSKDLLKDLLKKVLHKDVPENTIDDIVNQVDPKQNGLIDFDNFCDTVNGKKSAQQPEHELLSEDQHKDLKDKFSKVDPNNHGKITPSNLKSLLERIQVPMNKIEKLMDLAQPNRLGEISFNDFCNDVKAKQCMDKEGQLPHLKLEDLKKALAKADDNKDGKISKTKLKDALKRNLGNLLSDNQIKDLVDKAQPDRNGEINLEDFVKDLDDHKFHPEGAHFEFNAPTDKGIIAPTQVRNLKNALKSLDHDNDGKVSKDQIRNALMANLGTQAAGQNLWKLLAKAKQDLNGQVDINDFCQDLDEDFGSGSSAANGKRGPNRIGGLNQNRQRGIPKDKQQQLIKILKDLDHDKDGKISKEQLKAALNKHFGFDLPKEQIEDLLNKAQPDYDGLIDLEQYKKDLQKPQVLKDHPDFYVEQFAPKYRIAKKGKNIGNWRPATKEEFEQINYILASTELKNNTPVAYQGGRFLKNNDEFIQEDGEHGNEEFVLYVQDDSMPIEDNNETQHEIDTEDLGHVLRSIGSNPTKSQLNGMINQLDPNGEGTIGWQNLLSLMKNNKNLPQQAIGDLLNSIGPKPKNYNNYSDLNTTDSKHPFAQKRQTQDMLSTAQTEDKYINQYIQAWQRKTSATIGGETRLNSSLLQNRNNLGTLTDQIGNTTVDEQFDISPFDAQLETIKETRTKGSLIKDDKLNQSEILQKNKFDSEIEVNITTIKRKKKVKKTINYSAKAYTGLTTSASRKIQTLSTAESRKDHITIGTEVQRMSRQAKTAKRGSIVSSEGLRNCCVDCRCDNSLSKSRERYNIPISKGALTGLNINLKKKQADLDFSAKSTTKLLSNNNIKTKKKKSTVTSPLLKGRTSELSNIKGSVLSSGTRNHDYINQYVKTQTTMNKEGGDAIEDVVEQEDQLNKPRPAIEYESVLESLKNQMQGQQHRRIETESYHDMEDTGFKINLVKAATGKSSQYSNSYLNK